jgi:tetratricopeptide (TPR) repeat protein
LAKQSLKLNPDYRPAMVVLARDHYRARRLDLAEYTLKAILDGYGEENPPRDKDNADARVLRALILKEQGRRAAAISEFRKVIELRPDMVEARLNLATYMLEAGNAEQALPVLEAVIRYDNGNVLARLNLGDAYRLLGRPNEAIKQLEWVAAKDPKLAQVRYNLGLVYMFSQNIQGVDKKQAIDKAISNFERYKEMEPRTRPGAGDDVDELLKRAKNKKAIIEAMDAPVDGSLDESGAGDGA